jgi:hypothetical protein
LTFESIHNRAAVDQFRYDVVERAVLH